MPIDPAMPPNMLARLRDLEGRISKLERLPRLPSSSFQGGLFQFLDNDRNVRWAAGNAVFSATVASAGGTVGSDGGAVDVTTGYGQVEQDENGAMIAGQLSGFRGSVYPTTPIPMHRPEVVRVTSTSFTDCFEGRIQFPVGDVVKVIGAVQTDPGTTGELRLSTGTSHTNAVSLPSATNSFAQFEWVHPSTTGIGDTRSGREANLFLVLEARVVSGSGGVQVFAPQVAEIMSKWLAPTATTTGNPQLL